MPKKISNISLKEFNDFLKSEGCTKIRSSGGHDVWSRKDLTRPITVQNHIDPVPERIIKQFFTLLGIKNKKEFLSKISK